MSPKNLLMLTEAGTVVLTPTQCRIVPAKNYVIDSFDTSWYIPSIDELILLWNNHYHVNKALQGTGHPLIRLSDSYWSSTEYGIRDAWYIPFTNGNVSFGWKGISRYVRPIRSF